MCGENHRVECFKAAIGHLQLNPQRVAPDLGHRARQANVNIGPRKGALKAQQLISDINGANHTWFCGAWMRNGFHEDGLATGIDAARRLMAQNATLLAAAE